MSPPGLQPEFRPQMPQDDLDQAKTPAALETPQCKPSNGYCDETSAASGKTCARAEPTRPSKEAQFTAARIAAALGRSKRGVLAALSDTPETGKTAIAGNAADTWTLAVLPAQLRGQLERQAERRGYRGPESLLLNPPRNWLPPVSLSEAAPHCLDKAAKLQRALAPALERQNDSTLTGADFERLGIEDYRRVFGYAISARHWRALFKRTLDRDGGAEDFCRLDLYLDQNTARSVSPGQSLMSADQSEFRDLNDAIIGFKCPTAPTAGETAYFWLRTFEVYEARLAAHRAPKRTKRALLKFLERNAPFLGKPGNALRLNFKRKYDRWVDRDRRPEALVDARAEKSGHHRAPKLDEQDQDRLVAHAVFNCGGRVSQAWRELRELRELFEGEGLSQELCGYYIANPANKSAVPRRIRNAVKCEVKMLEDIHHGPRTASLNGAYILRDWNGEAASDWHQADDVTLPIIYYVPNDTGGFSLLRGQCILMIDLRSTRVLGYALRPENNYHSGMIRVLITKVCDEHGLPRKGFYFERGIWKNSKLLVGDRNADPLSWGEVELGLREFGLRFIHSEEPTSKPIERVVGAFQNLLEGDPGYLGRNEMVEKFERVQAQKREVEGGKAHPSTYFYDEAQWCQRIEELCAKYNAAPQGGKMTCGLSPDEAYLKFSNQADPPIRLDATCRYLLALHKRPLRVGRNGITLRFGSQVFNYRDEQTGRLRGQTVLAWFNPETPDILAVTDLHRKNPFCVARTQEVPAMDAPRELLQQELARIAAHQSYANARYRTLNSRFGQPFRQNLLSRSTAALGRAIGEQQAAVRTKQDDGMQRLRSIQRQAQELRMPAGIVDPQRPDAPEFLQQMREAIQNQERSREQTAAEEGAES